MSLLCSNSWEEPVVVKILFQSGNISDDAFDTKATPAERFVMYGSDHKWCELSFSDLRNKSYLLAFWTVKIYILDFRDNRAYFDFIWWQSSQLKIES